MANTYTLMAEQFPWPREASRYAAALATLVEDAYFQAADSQEEINDIAIKWPDRVLIDGSPFDMDDRLKTDALSIARDMDMSAIGARFRVTDEGFLYVSGDEAPDVETIARILQAALIRHNLPPVYFEWAATCDKLRAGQFGGGAAVISQNDQCWMSTAQWAADTCAAMEREAALDAGFESA